MNKYFLAIAICLCTLQLQAQKIPSPSQYLGYEVGTWHSRHHEVVGYFEALTQAAPDRMKIERFGQSFEKKPLMLAFIGSAQNIARLEEIRKSNLALAGMGGTALADAPVVVWLSYTVHGNEPSSTHAAMLTAHHLLTDPKAADWLKNTVVVMDPCLNPDGYDRYVNWYNSVVGRQMNPDARSREHREPWPGGRSNHYNFDMNRDWAWQTQAESRQRIAQYNRWMPQVHVDYHEQGYNEPYFFAPAAEPFHEVITPWQRSFQGVIGKNNARYFDKMGWLYFTRERFDLFYPSYGDTWPTYNGSIGMTYEQGGIGAGLGVLNEDGDTLTLAQRTTHHYTTGISTVEACSQNAADLLKNFKAFFDNTIANGSGEYKTYVVKAKGSAHINAMSQLLDRNGIQYTYANEGSATGYSYRTGATEKFSLERGDILISTQQPKGVLARVLFEPQSRLADSATYDITAWSVPYSYGLQAFAVKEKLTGNPGLAMAAGPLPVPDPNAYGYVVEWRNMNSARFLAACLKAGIKPRFTKLPLETKGKKYERGSLLFVKTSNERVPDYYGQLFALAQQNGVSLDRLEGGMADRGPDMGSGDVASIRAIKVAMLTGEGTSSLDAGQVWHYFDNELNYPVTLVDLKDAGGFDFKGFDVVVVPSGYRYGGLLGKDGNLRRYVEQGGTIIAFDGAVGAIAGADMGLSRRKDPEEKPGTYDLLKTYADSERESLQEYNSGSIFKLFIDNTHPLAFGYDKEYFSLKGNTEVYDFVSNGWNVGVMKKEGRVAGFTGSKALEKMKDGVVTGELPVGRGSVVFFADDILFRSFWENGKLFMANALFFIGGEAKGYRNY